MIIFGEPRYVTGVEYLASGPSAAALADLRRALGGAGPSRAPPRVDVSAVPALLALLIFLVDRLLLIGRVRLKGPHGTGR